MIRMKVNLALKKIAELESELIDMRRELEDIGEMSLVRELKYSTGIDDQKHYLNRWLQENE